jgi:predicted lipid-binding transport protein (Tim44 family)
MSAWMLILGLVLMAALVLLLRRRPSDRAAAPRARAEQASMALGQSQLEPATPRGYSPKNVGNDASARPWESTYNEPLTPSGLEDARLWGVPDGFDVDDFLRTSRANFVSLQDAWDRADIASLRAMMTGGMLEQIQGQLNEREQQSGARAGGKTDVVMVEARLLGMEDLGEGHMASVEFSGLMREDGAGPSPFREIWSISRAKGGQGGWLVAGVQALQ